MRGFPRFVGWINQNLNQKDESKRSEKVVKLISEPDEHPDLGKTYLSIEEGTKQARLWRRAERHKTWHDKPPKIKVTTTKKGVCHMNIELTLGGSPESAYESIADRQNAGFIGMGDPHGPDLMKSISRKSLKKDGPRDIAKVKKKLRWKFLLWSGYIPITLIVDDNQMTLTGKYKKEKMMFMKVFEGNWKIEPLFVDKERLCKRTIPKTREEYEKCSNGQGKIAALVTIDQYFEPYPPFNIPPVSWYIQRRTIETTKKLILLLQLVTIGIRGPLKVM